MRIDLAYGDRGLIIDLPDAWDVTVIEPRHVPGLPDPGLALRSALRQPLGAPPLRDLARPGQRVGVVFSDITRPTPHQLILPAVLAELDHLPPSAITLFNALGTHRPNTDAELRSMLGDALVDGYRIVQNDCADPATQLRVGTTARGNPVWLNRELVACDLVVLTGFIEPHFFAGFSGGGKAVMPGMAGLPTILFNHGPAMIGDPRATWGVTHGNPIWEEVREVAARPPPKFLVNVALNRDRAVTGVFAGDLDTAHAAGCAFVRGHAMVPVARPFDIGITTNSGYPLDLNLYQSVKGMSAAAQVVKPGGAIVVATECRDGVPEHGRYGQLLGEWAGPAEFLAHLAETPAPAQDLWQVQIQALIQQRADVFVYSDHLAAAQIRAAWLRPCPAIEATVADLMRRHGPTARIGVLPQGPQTIPYLTASAVA